MEAMERLSALLAPDELAALKTGAPPVAPDTSAAAAASPEA